MISDRFRPYERVRVVCLRRNTLLLVQHRWHDGSYFWLLPGGGIKAGESIEDAAVREVWEEAGVRIRVLRQLHRPAGITGAGPEHAFVLAEPLDDETRGPQPAIDGDAVFAVEWHAISASSPIGGLTPEFWVGLGPLLMRLAGPSESVLAAFGASEPAVRLTTGQGQAWVAGAFVLKPVDDELEARWVAELSAALPQHGFRLARPIATREGRYVSEGWCAWTRVEGEHSATRWPELLSAAAAFHQAVRNLPKPDFIAQQERSASASSALDRWRVADRIAWDDAVPDEFAQRAPLDALFAARRPVELPAQLIHGDLVGNVLFADGLPPAIIDLSLYWHPVGYSAALVVGDALVWEGASREITRLLAPFDHWPQLLLRAVLFRMVVNELSRRLEPSRADLRAEYKDVVGLVLSLVAE